MSDDTIRINLISGPRNISTALMYSFANRPDTTAIDEPMYAHYLHHSGKIHPMRDEIMSSQPTDIEQVKSELFFCDTKKPIYFIKGMAHHFLDVDPTFLLKMTNVFLIRNPRQLLHSFSKVIENPEMMDVGLKLEFELYEFLVQSGSRPVVVDSNEVLKDPKKVLSLLCDQINIPFADEMLAWPANPSPYDGVWAPHWYANVHKSTSFIAQDTSYREIRADLLPLLEECQYYYDLLIEHAITID